MKKLVLILFLVVSSLYADDVKFDTAKFEEMLEKEFNFQVNEYRREEKLDSLPTNVYLRTLCLKNNERLSKIPQFFNCDNNEDYRKIAHDNFKQRLKLYNETPRPFEPRYVNEIVASDREVTLTTDTTEIKNLAKGYMNRFSFSVDHNEVLISPLCFTLYTKFSVVECDGKLRLICTSAFTERIK